MPLIPVQQDRSLVLLLLVLIVSTLLGSTATATPLDWPKGWSTPVLVASGHRNQGYSSIPLGVRSLLIATARYEEREYVLQVETVDIFSKQAKTVLAMPVQGLHSYMVFSHQESGSLGFVQRVDGVSQIYVQKIPAAGAIAEAPLLLHESTGVIANFIVVSDNQGNVFYAWSSNEQGLRNVFLQARDKATTVLWESMVDSPHAVDTTPFIAIDHDVLYLLNRQRQGSVTELVYRVFDLNTGDATALLNLGQISASGQRMPELLTRGDGSVDLVWAKETLSRGQVRGIEISLGRLNDLGEWITPLFTLHTHAGALAELRSSRGNDTILVWLTDSSGSFQVNHLVLDYDHNVISQGPVTIGSRHRFAPQVHWIEGQLIVLFQELDADELQVFLVDRQSPAKPPLAFWLGLDLEAPLLDGSFRYISLVVASVTLGFLATLGLAISLGLLLLGKKIGLIPQAQEGLEAQLMIIFALLSLIKRSGTFLYFGAVLVPGLVGILIAAGSAMFALVALRLSGMDEADTLTLAVGGFMFVVCDAFCSLYVRGLGKW